MTHLNGDMDGPSLLFPSQSNFHSEDKHAVHPGLPPGKVKFLTSLLASSTN